MKKFYLLSTQRSGSTWIARQIAGMYSIKFLGELTPKVTNSLNEFNLDKVLENSDGHFYKLMYNQVGNRNWNTSGVVPQDTSLLKDIPCIHLIRRDTWSQAKSEFIMNETLITHSTSPQFKKLNERKGNVQLDFKKIEKACEIKNKEKEKFSRYLKSRGNSITIFYEDLKEEIYWNVFGKKLKDFLGLELQNEKFDSGHKKINKYFEIENKECIEDFLKEDEDLLKKYSTSKQKSLASSIDKFNKIESFLMDNYKYE